ncbi:MAG: formate dehydrogenase accessory protein FdhE [Firmicutes bacterium]|nr:formate dehydrogenase accessory protein FdhE [Bacillota bacterium]
MDKGILKKFDQAIEKHPELAEILQFHRDILKEQIKVANKQPEPDWTVTEKEAESQLLKQEPLVKKWPVAVDVEQFQALFTKLAEILKTHRPETEAELDLMLSGLVKDDYEKIIRSFVTEDDGAIVERAKALNVNERLFSFLVRNALRPFYIAYAEVMRHLVKEHAWADPYCPVCGAPGRIGKLDGEGGKRSLYCSLCDTVWKYKRLECPYCGSGHEQVRYLQIEDSQYQIDVCEKCKGYIKVLDARELTSEPYMLLEDLLTMELDLLAQKEGYTQDPELVNQ